VDMWLHYYRILTVNVHRKSLTDPHECSDVQNPLSCGSGHGYVTTRDIGHAIPKVLARVYKTSYHLIQTSNVHLQSVFDGSAASYDSILARLVSIPVPNTCFYLTELFRSGAARVRSIDINQSSHFPNPDPPTRFRNVHHTRFGTPSLETFPA